MSKFNGLGSGVPPINTAAMREMAETAGAAVKQFASNVASRFNSVRQYSPEQVKQAFQSTFNTPQVQAALKMGAQKFADIQSRVNDSFDRMGKELPKVATEFRQCAESARQSAATAWSSAAKTLNPQNVASVFKNMRNSPAAQKAFTQAQQAFNNIDHAARAFYASARPKIEKAWEKLHQQRPSYANPQHAHPRAGAYPGPQFNGGHARPQGAAYPPPPWQHAHPRAGAYPGPQFNGGHARPQRAAYPPPWQYAHPRAGAYPGPEFNSGHARPQRAAYPPPPWQHAHPRAGAYPGPQFNSGHARPQRANNAPPQGNARFERPQGAHSGAAPGAHGAPTLQRTSPAVKLKENMSKEDVVALIGQLRAKGFKSEDFATVASLLREARTLGGEEAANALQKLRSDYEPRIRGLQSADGKTTRHIIQEFQKAATE